MQPAEHRLPTPVSETNLRGIRFGFLAIRGDEPTRVESHGIDIALWIMKHFPGDDSKWASPLARGTDQRLVTTKESLGISNGSAAPSL